MSLSTIAIYTYVGSYRVLNNYNGIDKETKEIHLKATFELFYLPHANVI